MNRDENNAFLASTPYFALPASVSSVTFDVELVGDGYKLSCHFAGEKYVLTTARDQDNPRIFKTLDAVVTYLSKYRDKAYVRLHLNDMTVFDMEI